jgi:hypothetical protein
MYSGHAKKGELTMSRFRKRFSRRVEKVVFGVYLTIALLPVPALAAEEARSEGDARPRPDPVPFNVLGVVRRQVDVLFKGLVENPFKLQKYEPKFLWGEGGNTHYVPVGESLHGYTVCPPEKRMIELEDPGQPPRRVERYFITLKKQGEDPIAIEIWKTARVTERIAILQATDGKWTVYYRDEKLSEDKKVFEVFDDCDIIAKGEGGWRKFKVARVSDKTVTLEGTYEYLLELPSPAGNSKAQR